jgi:hypothetical protein
MVVRFRPRGALRNTEMPQCCSGISEALREAKGSGTVIPLVALQLRITIA